MVRFGILGFGLHAAKRLLPAFRQTRNSELVAIARSDLAKAQAAAREHGIARACGSAAELCAAPEVDAVFVATPNARHLADVLCAVQHRKPVLCEKPMALNAAEAERMVAEARAAGVPLGVGQVFRFAPAIVRLRELVAAGAIGRPCIARSEFHYQGRGHARRWATDLATAGGGPVADVGVHCIDALRWVLDDEVAAVEAVNSRDADSGSVEAAGVLALRFARGALASVAVSFRADYRTPLEIVGESGVLRAGNAFLLGPVAIELARGGVPLEREEISNAPAFAAMIDAFAATVASGVPFPAPGEEGVRNQRILDAAYRSAAQARGES